MKNNKGYTLVELIVVIAIMAVLVGAGISLVGILPSAKTRTCVEDISKTIEKTRGNALSFKDATVSVYVNSSGVYTETIVTKGNNLATPVVETEITKVGEEGLEVYYVLGTGGTEVQLPADTKLLLKFDRSSGAFKSPSIGGVEQTEKCTAIIIKCGSSVRTIHLTPLTGKVS